MQPNSSGILSLSEYIHEMLFEPNVDPVITYAESFAADYLGCSLPEALQLFLDGKLSGARKEEMSIIYRLLCGENYGG